MGRLWWGRKTAQNTAQDERLILASLLLAVALVFADEPNRVAAVLAGVAAILPSLHSARLGDDD